VILFHGTTQSRAKNICANGFCEFDLQREINTTADTLGIPPAQILQKLTSMGRFSVSRETDSMVYLSTSFNHAASYATRSPEVVWECLWAVFLLRNSELGINWNQSNEGHYWVLRTMEADPPVVLKLDVEEDVLGDQLDRIKSLTEFHLHNPDNGAEVRLKHTTTFSVVNTTLIGHRIDRYLLRFVAGLPTAEFHRLLSVDHWGKANKYRGDFYWEWSVVKPSLPPERLEELDSLVGFVTPI
jgi:hypothetical protein